MNRKVRGREKNIRNFGAKVSLLNKVAFNDGDFPKCIHHTMFDSVSAAIIAMAVFF